MADSKIVGFLESLAYDRKQIHVTLRFVSRGFPESYWLKGTQPGKPVLVILTKWSVTHVLVRGSAPVMPVRLLKGSLLEN